MKVRSLIALGRRTARMASMATTPDPAHESVNLLTLLPQGLTLLDVSDPAYPVALDTTRWLYHEPTGLLTNKVYADVPRRSDEDAEAGGKGTAYSYTPDGKLATRTWDRHVANDPAQPKVATAYGYTASGELLSITYNDGTPGVTNQYDRLGRQVGVVDASGQRTFAYNDLLQLAAETNAMAVVERRYDPLGRDAGLSVAGLGEAGPAPYAVAYGYDAFGRFHSVSSLVFSAFSGAPSKVWQNLQIERYLPYELTVA